MDPLIKMDWAPLHIWHREIWDASSPEPRKEVIQFPLLKKCLEVERELQEQGAIGMSPMKAVLDSVTKVGCRMVGHSTLEDQRHQRLDLTFVHCCLLE